MLPEFRAAGGERRVAWEIGAGWGGFAYQFKTLCPNTTYVIVDLPELFLFSAVYLQTVFPEAKMRFYTEVDEADLFDGWQQLDFLFIPHTRLDLMRPPRCDLAINTVSFQEMSTAQVRGYGDHAFDLGVPLLYSLNRERSPYNPEVEGVSSILAERNRPPESEVLPTSYVAPHKPPKPSAPGAPFALRSTRQKLHHESAALGRAMTRPSEKPRLPTPDRVPPRQFAGRDRRGPVGCCPGSGLGQVLTDLLNG